MKLQQGKYGLNPSQENTTWLCPNCETRNNGPRCKLCNYQYQQKKQPDPWKWIAVGLAVLMVLMLICGLILVKTSRNKNSRTEEVQHESTKRKATHVHSWIDATCTAPKICKDCGETTGNVAGHQWIDATYDMPKSCAVCGITQGTCLEMLSVKTGDIVSFGRYEQDGIRQNGTEEIHWLVLDVQDEHALLLSLYAMDSQPYNEAYTAVTWENCSLRRWLNGAFFDSAFSSQEANMIVTTKVENSNYQGNRKWKCDGGNDTLDHIFLLSVAEAEQYFYGDTDRVTTPTVYAVAMGADTRKLDDGNSEAGWWWLRSPGEKSHHAAFVNFDGTIYSNAVGNTYLSVRPALWVDLSA